MLRRALLLFMVLGATLLSAQEKKELTLKATILDRSLYPERLSGLQWITGTNSYSFVKDSVLMRDGASERTDRVIATLNDLNNDRSTGDSLKRFPGVEWTNPTTFLFEQGDRTYAFDVTKKTSSLRLTTANDAENEDHDEAYGKIAFTRGENLFIAGLGDSITQVTFDGTDGIVNGKSVHREEYGITKGTFWSPDGNLLAFYRMDESMVTPYYVEDITTTPSTFKKFRYPMAGQTSHHVTLGVYDTRTGKTVFINPEGPADHYLTNISWGRDNQHVHIILLDRATDHFKVMRYDCAYRAMPYGCYSRSTDDKWLEPEHPLTFLKNSP